MKRRFIISAIAFILSSVIAFVIHFNIVSENYGALWMSYGLILVYIAIYIFGGLAKLTIYLIYGLLTGLLIYLWYYPLVFAIFGALLFVTNPLAFFEKYLLKRLSEKDTLPVQIGIYGSFWPNYVYRKAMKEYYHLPQARKLYTKKWYLYLRQISVIVLLATSIAFFISEFANIISLTMPFKPETIMTLYSILSFFIFTYTLYKKGYRSLFRIGIVMVLPIISYLIWLPEYSLTLKIIFFISSLVLAISVLIYEVYKYYHRVVYASYDYHDPDTGWAIHANALFETLVYNETYTLIGRYSLKVPYEVFRRSFDDILVYANFHRFLITAYAYDGSNIYIYTEFHSKKESRMVKFHNFLENIWKTKVVIHKYNDPTKKFYETNFFHKTEYIIARANYLAGVLKELGIESNVIISMIFYFERHDDFLNFSKGHYTVRLKELEENGDYYAIRTDILSLNVDYLIESKIRDVLLSAMVNHGNYVRISLYSTKEEKKK